MKNKNSKTNNVVAIVSVIMTIAYLCKNLFTRKHDEVRQIGEYTITLSKERMSWQFMFAETTIEDGTDMEVRTDMFFRLLPRDMQNVILAHEIGHHVCKEARPGWFQITRDPEQEAAADSFAALVFGKKLVLKTLLVQFLFSLSPEILFRMYRVLRGQILTVNGKVAQVGTTWETACGKYADKV